MISTSDIMRLLKCVSISVYWHLLFWTTYVVGWGWVLVAVGISWNWIIQGKYSRLARYADDVFAFALVGALCWGVAAISLFALAHLKRPIPPVASAKDDEV